MSRATAVHVVAGILFVGVGTTDAQESIPKPAVVEVRDTLTNTIVVQHSPLPLDCVAGIEGDVAVTVAIAPSIHVDDPNDNVEGRPNSAASPQDASDLSRGKARTVRKWFADAMLKVLEFVARGVANTSGR